MDIKIEKVLRYAIKEYLENKKVKVNKINMNTDFIDFDKDNIEKILEKFIKIKKKYFIVNKKMNVIYSTELKKKMWSLTKNQLNALSDIENKINLGKSIKPYLSNNLCLFKMSKKDVLLDDYKIYHLHLGEPDNKEHFATRTDKLLFLTYDENNVYFLDVKKHPCGDEWENINAINIKDKMNIINDKKIDDLLFKNKNIILKQINDITLKDEDEIKEEIIKLL